MCSKFAPNLGGPLQRIVLFAFAKSARMHVGGVKAGRSEYIRVHGGAEGKMAAEANSYGANTARAILARFQMIDHRAPIRIVGRQFFRVFVRVTRFGSLLIVSQDVPAGSNS